MNLIEARSVYLAKLNDFLADEDADVVKFIKNALNRIFMGISKDFDGYIEGKRPTIKDYGTYKTLEMKIQANSDVKKDSNDKPGKWNFHYPVKDYCQGLGKIMDKKFGGDSYECVVYNHDKDLENARSSSSYDDLTSTSVYPMVGCYSTGIGGSYKNLDKNIKGTTYSVIVSVPVKTQQEFSNPFMTKQGTRFCFANDHHDEKDGSDSYSVVYDQSDGEFVITEFTEGSADRYTIIYRGSRNPQKAFVELVNTFDANTSVGTVQQLLTKNGLKVQHSWWFNPYTD